jgi:hypothetical protein
MESKLSFTGAQCEKNGTHNVMLVSVYKTVSSGQAPSFISSFLEICWGYFCHIPHLRVISVQKTTVLLRIYWSLFNEGKKQTISSHHGFMEVMFLPVLYLNTTQDQGGCEVTWEIRNYCQWVNGKMSSFSLALSLLSLTFICSDCNKMQSRWWLQQ